MQWRKPTTAKEHLAFRIDTAVEFAKMSGDQLLAMVLLEAHLSDHPEVTAEYAVERLDGIVSDDTVRRKLRKMERDGSVTCRKAGRTMFFRLSMEVAETGLCILQNGKSSV